MCDADVAPFDCHPEIYEVCENCEAEICGICLKQIMHPSNNDICPVCGHNIWQD